MKCEAASKPSALKGGRLVLSTGCKSSERRTLNVTSNLGFQDWWWPFDQPATAAAFPDRMLHHAQVISLFDLGAQNLSKELLVGPLAGLGISYEGIGLSQCWQP